MNVDIEEINGKNFTLVKESFDSKKVRESVSAGIPVIAEYKPWDFDVIQRVVISDEEDLDFIPRADYINTVVILPALPRFPKFEDIHLILKYASNNIFIRGTLTLLNETWIDKDYEFDNIKRLLHFLNTEVIEITHAYTLLNERVEIAIERNLK